jgi:hypothetical protein
VLGRAPQQWRAWYIAANLLPFIGILCFWTLPESLLNCKVHIAAAYILAILLFGGLITSLVYFIIGVNMNVLINSGAMEGWWLGATITIALISAIILVTTLIT